MGESLAWRFGSAYITARAPLRKARGSLGSEAMAKDRDDYTAANRLAWEASAPYHEEGAEFAGLLAVRASRASWDKLWIAL